LFAYFILLWKSEAEVNGAIRLIKMYDFGRAENFIIRDDNAIRNLNIIHRRFWVMVSLHKVL